MPAEKIQNSIWTQRVYNGLEFSLFDMMRWDRQEEKDLFDHFLSPIQTFTSFINSLSTCFPIMRLTLLSLLLNLNVTYGFVVATDMLVSWRCKNTSLNGMKRPLLDRLQNSHFLAVFSSCLFDRSSRFRYDTRLMQSALHRYDII